MEEQTIIEHHRNNIDDIDRQLVRLLNQRAFHAIEIGRIKKKLNVPIYDPEREEEIFQNLLLVNTGPLTPEAMQRLFERIIDESRRIERDSARDDIE
jgi:chorismate mutase